VVTEEQKELQETNNRHLLTRYLGSDLVDFLLAPTPKEYVESRPIRGGGNASYVAGHNFIKKLNQAFGLLWSSKVTGWTKEGDQIVVQRELSFRIPGHTTIIEHPDGTKDTTIYDSFEIVKGQFGRAEVKRYSKPTGKYKIGDVMDLGNDFKAAATDGLKKCALEIGMFADVYSERGAEEEGVSQKQLEVLYMRGKNAGMSPEETDNWVEEKLGKKVTDCEPIDIMGLVPTLIRMAKKE